MAEASGEFQHLSDAVVHEGHIWNVVVSEFVSPTGERFSRDIVRSPGAVGIVPLIFDAEGNPSVVLVKQYRPTIDQSIIEIPAGMRDIPGEDTVGVARRELIEEAGLSAGHLELLTETYPSAGMTDATMTIYLATECTAVPTDRHGPEEAYMELLHLPLVDALALVDQGEIRDGKTVAALLLTDRRLRAADER